MKGIIFDFDGTLADTLPLCIEGFRQVFKKFNQQTLSDEAIVRLFGPSEKEIIVNNLYDRTQGDAAIAMYYQFYRDNHHAFVQIEPGIIKLLQDLKAASYLQAILTGKDKDSLDISLQIMGIADCFDTIIVNDGAIAPKPAPDGLLAILDAWQLESSQALFLGDMDADILAGAAAGVKTVGVNWFTTEPLFKNTQPEIIITEPKQLFALL